MQTVTLHGGRIVTPDSVLNPGWLTIEDGLIARGRNRCAAAPRPGLGP